MPQKRISFTLNVEEGVSDQDLLLWLKYQLGIYGSLESDNPLLDEEWDVVPTSLTVTAVGRAK